MTWRNSYDAAGNEIKAGDVCVRATKSGKCEYCVFSSYIWGGPNSKGEFGKFYTNSGITHIKFSNVLLACDPIGTRNPKHGFNEIVRRFYEETK